MVMIHGRVESPLTIAEWLKPFQPSSLIIVSDDAGLEPIRQCVHEAHERRQRNRDRDRERNNRTAARLAIAEADRELSSLQTAATAAPGFWARFFRWARPQTDVSGRIAEWQSRRNAALAELHRIDTRYSRNELDERPIASEESRNPEDTPLPDLLTRSLDSMTELLDRLSLRTPAELTADDRADICLTLAAERIDSIHSPAIRRTAPAQLLIGESNDGLFASVCNDLAKPAWSTDEGKIICRFRDRGPDGTAEAVIDDPAVEARFTSEGQLAEIVFPIGRTAAQARQWLAANLDEARPVAFGEPHWTIGDRIVASWQSIVGAEIVESVAGVREFVQGTTANAPTAAIEFDPDCGWNRESAEAWLMDRLALSVPPMLHIVPTTLAAIPESTNLVS
jgi:hypothetical protein